MLAPPGPRLAVALENGAAQLLESIIRHSARSDGTLAHLAVGEALQGGCGRLLCLLLANASEREARALAATVAKAARVELATQRSPACTMTLVCHSLVLVELGLRLGAPPASAPLRRLSRLLAGAVVSLLPGLGRALRDQAACSKVPVLLEFAALLTRHAAVPEHVRTAWRGLLRCSEPVAALAACLRHRARPVHASCAAHAACALGAALPGDLRAAAEAASGGGGELPGQLTEALSVATCKPCAAAWRRSFPTPESSCTALTPWSGPWRPGSRASGACSRLRRATRGGGAAADAP